MPPELGPYRSPPSRAARLVAHPASRWTAVAAAAIVAGGLGIWLAPGVTAAIVGAVLFYVVAPWFVTRAPGP